ncbi:hypothetical protein AGMMS49921_03770 [Endomicrobiia bacterium]|nr:hypothetical protein AGMMS49921_03770 [Endomicrobiia bacterium]
MIKVENIRKRFGFKDVLCGVDFEVCDGETIVIKDLQGLERVFF